MLMPVDTEEGRDAIQSFDLQNRSERTVRYSPTRLVRRQRYGPGTAASKRSECTAPALLPRRSDWPRPMIFDRQPYELVCSARFRERNPTQGDHASWENWTLMGHQPSTSSNKRQ